MGNRIVRRIHKDAMEKLWIRQRRRMDVLYRLNRWDEGVLVPMEEPKFWGYRRELILRKDIANRRDADRLLELLKIVQNVQDCRRKDFKQWNPKLKRWEEWPHRPSKISIRRWEKLPESLRCFFHRSWDKYQFVYRITDPWMFETRRHKLWITHRRLPNVEVEQELDYLDARWVQACVYDRFYSKVKSRKTTRKWCWNLEKERLRDRAHRQEIEEGLRLHWNGLLADERGKEVIQDAETQI